MLALLKQLRYCEYKHGTSHFSVIPPSFCSPVYHGIVQPLSNKRHRVSQCDSGRNLYVSITGLELLSVSTSQ